MNNDKCCQTCYQGAYPCANTYCSCHGLRPATSFQEERNTEPWLSIEGVLWDVRGGVTLVEEGMKLIRGYLETTTPPQPDQFSQVAKKVPEPWVREFDDLMLVRFVSDSITLDYDGVQKIKAFIQKTLEADRKERARGGGNVM